MANLKYYDKQNKKEKEDIFEERKILQRYILLLII